MDTNNLQLPFKVKSIKVVNTGLDECDVEGVLWINETRICISNKAECIYDDGFGGTSISLVDEFDWSFKERNVCENAYVLIELMNG